MGILYDLFGIGKPTEKEVEEPRKTPDLEEIGNKAAQEMTQQLSLEDIEEAEELPDIVITDEAEPEEETDTVIADLKAACAKLAEEVERLNTPQYADATCSVHVSRRKDGRPRVTLYFNYWPAITDDSYVQLISTNFPERMLIVRPASITGERFNGVHKIRDMAKAYAVTAEGSEAEQLITWFANRDGEVDIKAEKFGSQTMFVLRGLKA